MVKYRHQIIAKMSRFQMNFKNVCFR